MFKFQVYFNKSIDRTPTGSLEDDGSDSRICVKISDVK